MSRSAKALARLQAKPADFTWSELAAIMDSFGYLARSGDGSSRKFIHPSTGAVLMMHEPHPGSILKAYQVRAALKFLTQEGHL